MWGFFAGGRLSRLEERIEKVENALKTAELDFDELYAKCRKLLGRTVKERASVEAHTEDRAAAPQPIRPQAGPLLSDRQREIQQAILRRRTGG